MHAVIVFDHPYLANAHDNQPHQRSFSAALLRATLDGLDAGGHTADVLDLQADRFNPVMSGAELTAWRRHAALDPQVLDYQRRLAAADHLVFVFPIWWESMPASTKGFLDKVMTRGFAYEEPKPRTRFVCLLKRLDAVTMLTTMSVPRVIYRLWFRQPASSIVLRGTFQKMGFPGKKLRWFSYESVGELAPQKRQALLDRTRAHFAALA